VLVDRVGSGVELLGGCANEGKEDRGDEGCWGQKGSSG
jgi:hypothetical protein